MSLVFDSETPPPPPTPPPTSTTLGPTAASTLALHSLEVDLLAGPQIRQRLNGLDDLGGTAHGDGPVGDISRDDAGGADGTALADGDAGQDDGAAADPAVVADDDGLGKLDVLAARRHLGLVRRCEDGDIGPEHDAVADQHQRAVEYYRAGVFRIPRQRRGEYQGPRVSQRPSDRHQGGGSGETHFMPA